MAEIKLQTLSERLKYAIEEIGITQTEVAKRINVKPQTIQYLVNGNAEWSKFTFEIAHALDVNPKWLANGQGEMYIKNSPSDYFVKAPILSKNEILQSTNLKIKYFSSTENECVTGNFPNHSCFATYVADKSMWPQLDEGTLVIIDPEKTYQDGHIVIVFLQKLNTIVLRKLSINKNETRIIPYNLEMYNEIKLSSDDRIIGSVIEARLVYR